MPSKYKIHESRKRSLFKTIGVRIIELAGDTFIIGFLLNLLNPERTLIENYGLGFVITLIVDLVCLVLTYLWERIWTRIEYGRRVHEKGQPCEECNEDEKDRSCH